MVASLPTTGNLQQPLSQNDIAFLEKVTYLLEKYNCSLGEKTDFCNRILDFNCPENNDVELAIELVALFEEYLIA